MPEEEIVTTLTYGDRTVVIDPKKEYSDEPVDYQFTENELKEIASGMATEVDKVEKLEALKKSTMDGFNVRIKHHTLGISVCAKQLRDGHETREIKCEVVKDFERGIVQYVRTDTGETARERVMSQPERQQELPFDDNPPE